jgi:hypothetical protein
LVGRFLRVHGHQAGWRRRDAQHDFTLDLPERHEIHARPLLPACQQRHELADFLYNGKIPREQTSIVSGGYGLARYVRRELRGYRPGQIMNGAYQYGAIGPDVGYALGVAAGVQLGAGVQKAYQGHPIIATTGDAARSKPAVSSARRMRGSVSATRRSRSSWPRPLRSRRTPTRRPR